MLKLEKILLKIILLIVFAYFAVMLFCGCRTKKQVVENNIEDIQETVTIIDSEITYKEEKEESTTEIDYVLDSGQIVSLDDIIKVSKGKGKNNSVELKVKEVKVKNANIKVVKNEINKISEKEEKKAETKQNVSKKDKQKPNSVKIFKISVFSALVLIFLFLIWRYRII